MIDIPERDAEPPDERKELTFGFTEDELEYADYCMEEDYES